MSTVYSTYQFNGDTAQQPWEELMVWRSRVELLDSLVNFQFARVVADWETENETYQAQLDARAAAISANADMISRGLQEGRIASFMPGEYTYAGDNFEEVAAVAAYSGDAVLTFKLYADGVLVLEKKLHDNKPFALPGGYRAREIFVEVETNLVVKSIDLATSLAELKFQPEEG